MKMRTVKSAILLCNIPLSIPPLSSRLGGGFDDFCSKILNCIKVKINAARANNAATEHRHGHFIEPMQQGTEIRAFCVKDPVTDRIRAIEIPADIKAKCQA